MSSITVTPVSFRRPALSRAAGSRASRARFHLTRRGRVFLTLVVSVLLAVALMFLVMGHGVGAIAAKDAPAATVSHITVMPGQSLWQIAENVAPHSDPRTVVSELISFNGLSGSTVMPGQSLAIPSGL